MVAKEPQLPPKEEEQWIIQADPKVAAEEDKDKWKGNEKGLVVNAPTTSSRRPPLRTLLPLTREWKSNRKHRGKEAERNIALGIQNSLF